MAFTCVLSPWFRVLETGVISMELRVPVFTAVTVTVAVSLEPLSALSRVVPVTVNTVLSGMELLMSIAIFPVEALRVAVT